MKSVKRWLAVLVFGGTILMGTRLTAQAVEGGAVPPWKGPSVSVPRRSAERGLFLLRRSEVPRPLPPQFAGPRGNERPEPLGRGHSDLPAFGRRFNPPHWASPRADVAGTLVPTDQLSE